MPHDKAKVTIYDVADRAGVAISTVSRVLNDSSDVSARTRARVLEAIEELQFRPDRIAKSLAQQRTRALAIAVPTFTTPFHNELLKGIRNRLGDHDSDLLLFDLGSAAPRQRLINMLKRGTVDGLLLAGVAVDETLTPELKALHAPVVLVGHHHTDFDCYYWDDVAGARQATEHLIQQGHRRIAIIRSQTDSYLQKQRMAGYRAALDAAGIPFDMALSVSGTTEKHAGFSEENGYEAMQQLLALAEPVTAVVACSDVQAFGAIKALREANKRVPEDFALVGYDDVKVCDYLGLSSVDQDMEAIGREAAARLIDRLEHDHHDGFVQRLIIPQLRVRHSSQYQRPS